MPGDRVDRPVEDTPAGSPALIAARPTTAQPNNLPIALAGFVGRTEALAAVERAMTTARLLTLTGPGGVGKSRLALQVAGLAVGRFRDGAWWVDLGSLGDAGLVPHHVALALGLPENPALSKEAALGLYLQSKELLLVLDNCEHLAAACAALAQHLLATCPRLRILATSREPLGVTGEMTWTVPPLSLPCQDEAISPESVARSESGQLFLDRALSVRPDLEVTQAVARAIGQVCCQLDGLPLAIELAAARVRVLSVPQIADHLHDRFHLLIGGSRTGLRQHQTLQATMDWSYDLLSRPERRLFERLSVFAGGHSLEGAKAVAGGQPGGADGIAPAEVLDLLEHLVLKSLVGMTERDQVRYHMLETIRQYAAERLAASGEVEQIRGRHLAYYLELARRAEPGLRGAEQVEWLKLVETEHDNLRAALAWSEESGTPGPGLQLATALGPFWIRAGYLSEGRRWLERGLAACREVNPARAQALYQAGRLAKRQGDYEQALVFARKSLALSHRFRDRQGEACALGLTGRIRHWQGDLQEAGRLLEEALVLARASGDQRTIARTLGMLGAVLLHRREHERAAEVLDESLGLYERLADLGNVAWVLGELGHAARLQGDYRQANARITLGLSLCQELDSKSEISFLLDALATLAADQGQFRRAAYLWAGARAVRDSIYAPLPPSHASDLEPYMQKVRAALGEEAFAAAWLDGLTVTVDQAIALAEGDSHGPPDAPAAATPSRLVPLPGHSYGLTPREVEVLRLVANGLSDAQIAGRLVISRRTVGKHLQSIYSKLYLPSRSAATRWAIEHGLA